MANYNNGKIYKLVNNVDDQIYIGSTCKTLTRRLNGHRSTALLNPDRQIYKHFNIIGFHNVSIILIEVYPCLNKLELEQRERHYIDQLKPQLNSYIPTRTIEQYRIDNKETIKQYRDDHKDTMKQYRIDNESIKLQKKQYNKKRKSISASEFFLKFAHVVKKAVWKKF